MKTTIIFIIIVTIASLLAVSSDGCDKDKDKKHNVYLFESNEGLKYCWYKVFEDQEKEIVIDTICISCVPSRYYLPFIDSVEKYCITFNDSEYVWRQEYSKGKDTLYGYRMFIEKIKETNDCIACETRLKSYDRVAFNPGF